MATSSSSSALLPLLRFLNTGCHELLPTFLVPMFTSKTFVPLSDAPPIPIWGAALPPLTYYLALLCLSYTPTVTTPLLLTVQYFLALTSALSFILLPFTFHVPGSAVFTYQLGLIGCFGSARVIDLFFLSRPRVPRRIKVPQPGHKDKGLRRPHHGHEGKELDTHMGGKPVYPPGDNLGWEFEPHPKSLGSRLWWALDLMISMRGIGWDFASADVRHDVSPWQPPSSRQIKMALFRLLPALATAILITRHMLARLGGQPIEAPDVHMSPSIVDLPVGLRPVLVLATGISLYTLFDAGYTLVSAAAMPIMGTISKAGEGDVSLHNVDFFPLLNPLKLPEITSVRTFWSKAWHRLFHRAFLIFGILPFQNLALYLFPVYNVPLLKPSHHPDPARMLPKGTHDWAKVMGAFCASGLVHAISERAALGGRVALPENNFWLQAGWNGAAPPRPHLRATAGLAGRETSGTSWSFSRVVPPISGAGEFTFFFLNGVAVLIEGAVWAFVRKQRRREAMRRRQGKDGQEKTAAVEASAVASRTRAKAAEKEEVAAASEPQQQPAEEQPQSRTRSGTPFILGSTNVNIRPTMGTVAAPRRSTFRRTREGHAAAVNSEVGVVGQGEDDGGVDLTDEDNSDNDDDKLPGSPPSPSHAQQHSEDVEISDAELTRWYDRYVGLVWAVAVLLTTGETFVDGWIKSGILAEISFAEH